MTCRVPFSEMSLVCIHVFPEKEVLRVRRHGLTCYVSWPDVLRVLAALLTC